MAALVLARQLLLRCSTAYIHDTRPYIVKSQILSVMMDAKGAS